MAIDGANERADKDASRQGEYGFSRRQSNRLNNKQYNNGPRLNSGQ